MASHAIVATNGLDQAIYVLHATSDHLRKMPPLYELEITEDGNVKVIGVSRH
ncbi:hypothetical protein [Escherichia coli]|nr:hypothetical protein [Escherichia coli]